jgi:hypothetical protein
MGQASAIAKWTLIPALTLAGFVSAIFTGFIWWPSIVAGHNSEDLYVVLGSTSFGLALGAVVWCYGLVQSWKILGGLVAVTVAAHLLELHAETHAGNWLREYVEIPVVGNVEPLVAATSFGVALVLYIVWILLTSPRYKVTWAVVVALGCAFLAALTVTAIHGTQRGAWISFFTGRPLELVWQTALAGFLGLALALKQPTHLFHAPPETEKPHSSFAKRMAVGGVLLGYFLVTGTWSTSVATRDARRRAQLAASIEAEAATKIAHAPSFDNLPPLTVRPFDEVLVWENIGEWTPSAPGSYVSPALRNNPIPLPGQQAQVAPERKTYYLGYSKSGGGPAVRANVTVYPNEQWARYEVDVPPITRQARNIKLLQRFGNNIYQDGPYFYWSSGDKVVNLDCQMVPLDVIDEFLKAYLQKFPSNV